MQKNETLKWLYSASGFSNPESDDNRFESMDHGLESVDQRLTQLLKSLSHYRLRLDSQVSDQYRIFERKVLAATLYRSDYDSLGHISPNSFPSLEDQRELIRVFEEVGILDSEMGVRIRSHFAKADEALEKLQAGAEWNIEDIFIIPLIRRTLSIVKWARRVKGRPRRDLRATPEI